jgi:RNA polymerase sigma factor (TIGR02999 family)
MHDDSPVTQLLSAWRAGNAAALNEVMSLVYPRLHEIAQRHLRGERAGHTLQSTALINEAFLALVASDVALNDRVHFFAVASNIMRRILIDHARAANRDKRGGKLLHVTLHDDAPAYGADGSGLLELDSALEKLAVIDERKAQIVEMHFFGGLNYEEIAEVLGVSAATVNRELRFSKAWIRRELTSDA